MKILVTGSAGFIGSALTLRLLARGDTVIGIDNHNNYYDPALKEARLARHAKHPNYTHLRIDLADRQAIQDAFKTHQPQRVDANLVCRVHLCADRDCKKGASSQCLALHFATDISGLDFRENRDFMRLAARYQQNDSLTYQ